MKSYLLMVSCICLASCMTNNALEYDSVSLTNQYHMARVRKGMSELQVLQIMHKPYKYETYKTAEDVYDVWFYVTRTTGLDQSRMVPQNMTPLTFKNGVLVGTGYSWYYHAMNEEAAEKTKANPPPEKPKSQELEDREFEKTLQPEPKANPKTALASAPKVELGMTEAEVTHRLGAPNRHETYYIGDDTYDVWFYSSSKAPLTFKNSVLTGTSTSYYKKIKQSGKPDQVDGYDRESERMEEDESEQNFNYW